MSDYLNGDEIEKIYVAASLGQENPVDTPEGRALFEEINKELDEAGEVRWDIPKN